MTKEERLRVEQNTKPNIIRLGGKTYDFVNDRCS